MQIGASLPCGDIGVGAAVIRDYVQAAEGMGFDYLQAPDHVLGGNPAGHKDKKRVGTTADFLAMIEDQRSRVSAVVKAGGGKPKP